MEGIVLWMLVVIAVLIMEYVKTWLSGMKIDLTMSKYFGIFTVTYKDLYNEQKS